MGTTPDRFPGSREEDELQLTTDAADPTVEGALRYNGAAFRLRDATGVFDPRTGGSGLTPAQHEALDQLVHNVAEDSFQEVNRTSNKVQTIIFWTDSGKTVKIRETVLTRDPVTTGPVSVVVLKQYDGAGALAITLTGTLTRASGKVASIDWVVT